MREMNRKIVRRLAACVGLLALAAASAPALAEDLIVDHVTLVDGTGHPKQADMSIGVDKGRITFVSPTSLAPKVAGRHLDGRGKYLMPGLMDVHIHLKGLRGGDGRRMVGKDPKGAASGAPSPLPDEGSVETKESHDAGVAALASYLYSGVTTIYDAGNSPDHILPLRAEERAGKILA